MVKKILFNVVVLLFPASFFAQLSVSSTSAATQLAQTITGAGVAVTNAVLSCDNGGAGTFSYSGSTLNLTNGIILTTGLASDASMPAQIVSQPGFNQTGNNFYDPALKKYFKSTDPVWFGEEPIWVTAEKQHLLTASFFWIDASTPRLRRLSSVERMM